MSTIISLFKEQLENQFSKLRDQFELTKRGDFLIWWYFMRIVGLSPEKVEQIVCDGAADLGLDAIYVDEEEYVHFYQFKNPERYDGAFPGGEVDKVLSGLSLIISGRFREVANPALVPLVEEIYSIVPKGYVLHFVSTAGGLPHEAVVKVEAFIRSLAAPSEAFFSYKVEDIQSLQDQFYRKTLPVVEQPIVFQIEKMAPYQLRSAEHDCYLFHTKAKVLSSIYDTHGEQLLQQNIRVFQGEGATNSKILESCTGTGASKFIHYNNGITFLCESAVWDQFRTVLTLNRAQVVNGGQTLRVLNKAAREKKLMEETEVTVRVITSRGDKEFASEVAVNQNNQNRVEASFLRSNDQRIVQLSAALESAGWYLERRENEVFLLSPAERHVIEQRIHASLEERLIPLRTGAQAYASTFCCLPEVAKKNPKKIFIGASDGGYFERVFGSDISAENFILSYRALRATDKFVGKFLALKRKKSRMEDWRKDYSDLFSKSFVDRYGDILDQVVPQSAVFITGLIHKVNQSLGGATYKDLVERMETEDSVVVEHLLWILDCRTFQNHDQGKSWPTLLKSQTFFDNVVSYAAGLKRR